MRACLDCGGTARAGGSRCALHQKLWEMERSKRPGRLVYRDPAYVAAREAMLKGGPVCALCGEPGADSLDHVRPISLGGRNNLENLQPAHRSCNIRKHNHPAPTKEDRT